MYLADTHAAEESSTKKFIISGNVGVPNVVLQGGLGGAVSDASGYYEFEVEYGWTGNTRPSKEGYRFSPESRTYTRVLTSRLNQDYTAKTTTYGIAGTAGIPGVVIRGLPGNPTTDSTGAYYAKVPHGFSGLAKPYKEGYLFLPPSREYSGIKESLLYESYKSQPIMLTISGQVGAPGVLLLGSPSGVISDAAGFYVVKVEHGWKGVLTPLKKGYFFNPPSLSFDKVATNRVDVNFAAKLLTYEITGHTGMPGVVLKGLPEDPISDEKGKYSVEVFYGWTGDAEPYKEGFSFVPASRQYVNMQASRPNEDYQAAPISFTISGSTSVPGVVLKGLPGNPTTGAQGKYKVEVSDGWCGIVIPYRPGYSFEPSSRKYPCVTESMTYENYLGTHNWVTISGSIIIDGNPVSGVRVTADNRGGFGRTDAQGNYRVKVPYGWSGNLSPKKDGWFFDPPHTSYKEVTENIDNTKKPRSPQPSYRLGSNAKVLIVPISKIAPEEFDHLVQDTNVMLHLLRKNINRDQAGPAGGVFSDFGEFLGQPNCPFKAIYIQDYGILFSLEVEMPMAPSAPQSESSTPDASPQDSIWQRAQRELNQTPQVGMQMHRSMQQKLDPDEVVMDLIVLLRHASNIRHLGPDDRIIVTLLGKSPVSGTAMMGMGMEGYGGGGGGMGMGGYGGGMMSSKGSTEGAASSTRMMGGGMEEHGEGAGVDPTNPAGSTSSPGPAMVGGMGGMMSSDGGKEGVGSGMEMMGGYGDAGGGPYGGGMESVVFPGAPFVTTIVTVHVKKSTIDEFAQGKIDFKQFREAVQVFKY